MKAEYDLSVMKSLWKSYTASLKQQATVRLRGVLDYFKTMAEETGIPYQSLISLYLRDCVVSHRGVKSLKIRVMG